jgi:exo-beta-1,3-glucanase (GH17 family)
MKYSILVLGVIASAGISLLSQSSASATAIAPQQKATSSLTASKSCPDFNYTGTNEDGEREEVKTGKGRK